MRAVTASFTLMSYASSDVAIKHTENVHKNDAKQDQIIYQLELTCTISIPQYQYGEERIRKATVTSSLNIQKNQVCTDPR